LRVPRNAAIRPHRQLIRVSISFHPNWSQVIVIIAARLRKERGITQVDIAERIGIIQTLASDSGAMAGKPFYHTWQLWFLPSEADPMVRAQRRTNVSLIHTPYATPKNDSILRKPAVKLIICVT